jgi:hypothetical protein
METPNGHKVKNVRWSTPPETENSKKESNLSDIVEVPDLPTEKVINFVLQMLRMVNDCNIEQFHGPSYILRLSKTSKEKEGEEENCKEIQ